MMLQNIYPHIYHNEYTPRPAEAADILLCYGEGALLCAVEEGKLRLPTCGEQGHLEGQYLFSVDETAYFLWEGEPAAEQGIYTYQPTRALRDLHPDEHLFAAAAGESLWRWYNENRYCGKCACTMEKGKTERSLICSGCGKTVYPKICPAVIVAVTDGERLLLTKYAGRAFKRYALIAGFSEIGESVEDTVRREVMEEAGLKVKNLRFYRSQPWVYTDSLLMGFYCDLDGSDEIHRQESELSEAGWFKRDEIPQDYSAISLTGEMIEQFRCGKEPR